MQNLITNEELSQLPFIALNSFNPDHDDEACFTIHGRDFETAANMTFDEVGNRTYRLPTELSPMQRVCVLQAIDMLIDESFAVHSMCCNYGLYSDKGRKLVGFEEE